MSTEIPRLPPGTASEATQSASSAANTKGVNPVEPKLQVNEKNAAAALKLLEHIAQTTPPTGTVS
jgi:hypothetical protein